MKSKILLIGKNGQLGWELGRYLCRLGEVIALDRHQLDLTRLELICRIVREIKPSLVVNAAAYTSVDQAESDASTAQIVNGEAPGVLAEAVKEVGSALLHFSTDYVFDGNQNSPYQESDPPNPINQYGKTKLAGEKAIEAAGIPHLILRTSWVYGTRGRNFLLAIVRLAAQKQELRVVDDQIGAPTWSRMIAAMATRILAQIYSSRSVGLFSDEYTGTYHLTAGGQTSWRGFAQAILDNCSDPSQPGAWFAAAVNFQPIMATRVVPISTAEFPTPARRPAYSVLSNAKLFRVFGLQSLPWDSQLALCFRDADVDLGPDSTISHPLITE